MLESIIPRFCTAIIAATISAVFGFLAIVVMARLVGISPVTADYAIWMIPSTGFVLGFICGGRMMPHTDLATSNNRLLVSAVLLAVGLVSAAVGIQQLCSFSPTIGDSALFTLYFLGGTLIGAGALCPFHRTTKGALWGFSLPFLHLLCM